MADIYRSIHKDTAVHVIQEWLGGYQFQPGADGLEVIPPSDVDDDNMYRFPVMTDRVHDRLMDLRLLRHVPLCYLVPDAALLPSESIRFFHVDQTWVNRVIDGLLSAADLGTMDFAFSSEMLSRIRQDLDDSIVAMAKALVSKSTWSADQPMTGFLMRSEAVRRWPDMMVSAYGNIEGSSRADAQPPVEPTLIPVLRHESISDTIYIALFAGVPQCVELREPHVALRFGVEGKPGAAGKYETHQRGPDGAFLLDNTKKPPVDVPPLDISFRTGRVLNITDLAQRIKDPLWTGKGQQGTAEPRMVALDLERLAFVQVFSTPESNGEDSGWVASRPLQFQMQRPIAQPIQINP